ncbi:Transcriptional regulatory protein LiaR [subsurface metagenome]
MANIRVLIVDDHTLFRESLWSLLNAAEGIEVIGEAGGGIEAVHKATELWPDVVLMDIAMPDMNGLQATRLIKKKSPSTKVLILTMYDTEQYVFELIESGASGYILKKAAGRELVSAIKAVSEGDAYLYPSVARKVLDEYRQLIKSGDKKENQERLTERELELVGLIAEGKTNREIADLLNISLHTVKSHRLNLMRKLKVHDRTQLVRYAIREGLIIP